VHWLEAIDFELLRLINQTWANPFFDALMPFASGNAFFFPALILGGLVFLWKGGTRARLCALMLALVIWPGDSYVSNTIKKAVGRPRPYITHTDVRLPSSRTGQDLNAEEEEPAEETFSENAASAGASLGTASEEDRPARRKSRRGCRSMPSSHAFNWFAATMILLVYYRRSVWFMVPLACLVAFSRVYNGVHYPSDVLAGAILGAGCAAAVLWLLDTLWRRAGQRWFPLWWQRLPSLVNVPARDEAGEPEDRPAPAPGASGPVSLDTHWLRAGYVLIAVMLLGNLLYLRSGALELSGDEAYQWIWSKHPALSYYSKPPLIAFTQLAGTTLWGDNEFGVRFFAPVISAVLGILLLRFFARNVNARAGFFLLLIVITTPLLAVGTILMTVDPLSVLFWTAAMMSGWRAMQPQSGLKPWLWTGLWMGLGFLSKYTALFQWLCWAVLFALWKPARVHLRRPGPYVALLINLLCATPVIVWNAQHDWITVSHVVHDNAQFGRRADGASAAPAAAPGDSSAGSGTRNPFRYVFDFLGAEAALLNPVYFVAAWCAAILMWRRGRHDPRMVYLFSMGAPLFLCYLAFSFRARVLPNWIAPSVLPLFCLMAVYWDTRWRLGVRGLKPALIAGLLIGGIMVALLHESDLIKHVAGRPLPPKKDPLTRVRAYSEGARIVEAARRRLLAEGKPVFVISPSYQTTGLMTFYIPEARTNVREVPLVYQLTSDRPQNQFYFLAGYTERKGENAIYVQELSAPPLVDGWLFKWLRGETNLLQYPPRSRPLPQTLTNQFESVIELGQFNALYRGRIFHTYQLFECRNLR